MPKKKPKSSIKTRFLILALIIIISNSVLGVYVIRTHVENILLSEHSKTLKGIIDLLSVAIEKTYNQYILNARIDNIYELPLPQQEEFFNILASELNDYLDSISQTFPTISITVSTKDGIPIIERKSDIGVLNPDFTYTIVKDININGTPIVKVVVWENKTSILRYTTFITRELMKATIILSILSLILTLVIINQMTKDVENLVKDIEKIAQSPHQKITREFPREFHIIAETVNDISERLWKNTQLLKDIIEASPMALILLDKDGNIRYKHQMSEDLYGLFPISQWLDIIMPNIKEYIRYKEYHILNRVRLGDRIFNIHVIPVRDGTLLALEDITDVSKMEEELRQKERLASLGTLAAGIAHEVRNPLTAIKGFAQMIAKRPTAEKNKKYIDFIIREVSKLEKLIKEILDFAKEKKPEKETVHLSDIINNLKDIIQNIDIKLDTNATICGDPNLLSSVFLNIIQNAKDAGATEVTITAKRYEDKLEVRIKNNGPPIPEDILPHIFEPFSTRKSKGTGLGLAIVHNIITSHGGHIAAYNDLDGVVFVITLPNDCEGLS